MSLYIETEGNISFSFDAREIAETVVEASLEYVQCPYEAEVSLLITHDEEIREMNREHRGIDRATDVLSFPMLEFERPGDFTGIDEEMSDVFDPESGELMLGDIVISADKVIAQAEEYGHSPKREYAFLIAHSMLHLCGYDHMEDDERKVMEQKQREIMEKINILR
ncbi:MAG TPA: rRNA maturation RNase YbeY [Candidatus Mediterraneibacter gallistercoris]|uniref:Endoribonuclease YbeY n=1 Tax=Candidatus Mediterraneibacter gallistercoris TaxID=2838671 RepID=A0A9D2P3G3_9FIRM|nr:rRNA maturation RNase YbeY [Candidatus Mediterraneibacter gallistercoris]